MWGADDQDLSRFGYRQQLFRTLGSFSAFAAGFSYISILTGLFQTFYLGYAAGGPVFVWTWPVMLVGQLLVALCFAELAAHYPLSGGVYQWAKQLGGPAWGQLTGGVYLACLVVTLAAVAMALQNSLPLISARFQWAGTSAVNAVYLGSLLLVASTAVSAYGMRLVARLNNVGVLTEIVGVILLIGLFLTRARRGPSEILFDGNARHPGAFLGAMALTASYVLYGFDTAGALAEETHDPRRRAPPAILRALLAAGTAGLLVLTTALLAAPDPHAAQLGAPDGGLPEITRQVLGDRWGRLFLGDVVFAIAVCTLAVQAGAARLLFAMARDGYLPPVFARISTRFQTPLPATLFSGLLATMFLLGNVRFPAVVELLTSISALWANLAYLLVVGSQLRRRQAGWPRGESAGHPALFSLGRWGLPVNAAAVVWCTITVVNVGWPRASVYGADPIHRFAPIALTLLLLAWGSGAGRLKLTACRLSSN